MRAGAAGNVIVLRQKNLRGALRDLAKRGIQRVLLEGGGHTMGQAFDCGLVQEAVLYVAPMLAGGNIPAVGARGLPKAAKAPRLAQFQARRIGNCLKFSGLLVQ
jgi:diaminohydroxyphosphoribosylaminopyrimidine deaminase/5-amino-6-(5-phosphoribosylamino)uracil reductase